MAGNHRLLNTFMKLLSTDFDGTLVDHYAKPSVAPDLFAALSWLQSQGVQWAINTGRELRHVEEGLREFGFTVAPDYVLTAEREVWHRSARGEWQDFGDWNRRCSEAHDSLFSEAGTLLADIRAFLARDTQAHAIYDGGRMVGIAAETDPEMDRIVQFLEVERLRVPGFQYMRNSIYVRFCHEAYSKGTALAELGRLLNVGPEETFACGDHYNDLPMLDGRFAKWVACPENSVETVKLMVEKAGGYVAKGVCSHGVLDALKHFGALPKDFKATA